MNTERFAYLSFILDKIAEDPNCVDLESAMEYQKEYNNLLMQREAERNDKKSCEAQRTVEESKYQIIGE